MAINYKNRAFAEGTAVLDIERGQLSEIWPVFWQTDTAISKNSWGYVRHQDYKTRPRSIVGDLVDIVSKNGVLLLNIGPRPDGTIPEPEQKILLEIGGWLAVNGEAIYGCRPWKVYGEGPTQVAAGAFTDTRRAAFTSGDFRFTVGESALFAVAMDWPESGAWLIRTLARGSRNAPLEIRSVDLLGTGPLAFTRTSEGLSVRTPPARPSGPLYTLKIT